MTNETETNGAPADQPPSRWPWMLGIAALAAVGVWLVLRPEPVTQPDAGSPAEPVPQPTVAVIEPLSIRVSPELTPADSIPASAGTLAGCNVLLVTLDTVRADRIGCYGNQAIDTPAIDGLARRGVLFSRAVTPAPTTAAAHASILTGRYPHSHGVRTNGLYRLADAQQTLAEVLSDSGYATAAMVSAFVLDGRFGLAQGFDQYDDRVAGRPRASRHHIPERTADQTTDRTIAWLTEHGREPFFLWVHFFDPHAPYEPPLPYAETYQQMPYDGEIAFADAQLARLLRVVEERGLADKTLVIVAGDHGEGLHQHGEPRHGYLLYDSTLHVPLIMACGDRLGPGVQVGTTVCLVDIVPTVLSLLGFESPVAVDGLDLTTAPSAERLVFAETLHGLMAHGWASLFVVRQGANKYIHGPDPELYDLAADPFERHNLLASRQQAAAGLKQRLIDTHGDQLDRALPAEPTEQLSAQDLAKLEALGYVGLANVEGQLAPAARPDPKAMLALKHQVDAAIEDLSSREHLQQAIAALKQIVAEHPTFEPAYSSLGECYRRSGALRWAESAYRQANQLRPNMPHTLLALARIKVAQQDLDTALALYRQLLSLYPDHFEALAEFGSVLLSQGRRDEAIDPLRQAFEMLPANPAVREALLGALQAAGRASEAVALLERSLAKRPDLASVRNSLARLLFGRGDYGGAIAVLDSGLELAPNHPQLANNLGLILANCPEAAFRDPPRAIELMERICRNARYSKPEYMLTLGIAYSAAQRVDDAIDMAVRAEQIARGSGDARLADTISRWLADLQQDEQKATATAPASDPPAPG